MYNLLTNPHQFVHATEIHQAEEETRRRNGEADQEAGEEAEQAEEDAR